MKILIVNDDRDFVTRALVNLSAIGIDASGITYFHSGEVRIQDPPDYAFWHEAKDATELFEAADVIFLDHNMQYENGKEILEYYYQRGVSFTKKRIVGISGGPQPYLTEKAPFRYFADFDEDRVKMFLGIG